ncbi:MAG: Vat family streptogramin A O-acetyltransferase [Bacteroidetes bacterium]|nr:Vat family streptogramin A O-acetyltransferase [Bacteroidota bacterium]
MPIPVGPDPLNPHPMTGFPQICYIRNTVKNPNILIGDFTYYDDPEDSENFERNVLYHFPFIGDKLIIGKFCAIAHGVKFIMNGANHATAGFSTYPFYIFGNGWESAMPKPEDFPYKGDTVIGHDVWIGYEALIMPGVKIGNGSIVAARSVVTSDVEPYSIVGGNPARVIRKRFDDQTISRLQTIGWWDWPADHLTRHLSVVLGADPNELEKAAPAGFSSPA